VIVLIPKNNYVPYFTFNQVISIMITVYHTVYHTQNILHLFLIGVKLFSNYSPLLRTNFSMSYISPDRAPCASFI